MSFPGSRNYQTPVSGVPHHDPGQIAYGLSDTPVQTGTISYHGDNSAASVYEQIAPVYDESWKHRQLRNLAINPNFQDLRTVLRSECHTQNSSPGALVDSQMMAASQSVPISARVAMLNLHFMKALHTRSKSQVLELQNFYYLKAADIESSRVATVHTASSPWILSSINTQYDRQHHQLIDHVENSLSLIEQNLVEMRCKKKASRKRPASCLEESDSQSSDSSTSSISPQHTKFTEVATRIMTGWYERNPEHPYPSYEAAQVMATAGAITVDQVKKWFANRRLKSGTTKSLKEIARRRKRVRTVSTDDILLLGGATSE